MLRHTLLLIVALVIGWVGLSAQTAAKDSAAAAPVSAAPAATPEAAAPAAPAVEVGPAQGRQPGAEAAKEWQRVQQTPPPAEENGGLKSLISSVQLITVVLIVLAIIMVVALVRLTGVNPLQAFPSVPINGALFIVFLLVGGALIVYEWNIHSQYLLPISASAHGRDLDDMLFITFVITGIAFVVTQVLLFWFSYKYRTKPGRVATYYHDNTRLEIIWTAIPAVVMAVLVLGGVRIWDDTQYPVLKNPPIHIELVAQQFNWNVRYPGTDNALGKADYRLISAKNNLGLDFAKDPKTHDDLIPTAGEIVLPIDTMVTVHGRAKDVLHGIYMPHFSVQVYAAPGMPTQFTFRPIMTTEQMRQKLNNPEFNYELACSQLCGSAHYNMRMVIRIVTKEEYNQWLATHKPVYTPELAAELGITPTPHLVSTVAAH